MVDIRELLYPNKFKVTLFLLLAIPCITIITVLLGSNYIYYNYYISHNLISWSKSAIIKEIIPT